MGLLLVSVAIVGWVSSCSSAQKKTNPSSAYGPEQPAVTVTQIPTSNPTESFGPSEPPPAEAVFGPTAQQNKKIKVVFTPGLARGFAVAGVLMALEQAGIGIDSVYGVEIPGLISSLYGLSQNQNEFEWWIQKLNPKDFVSDNIFGSFFKRGKISSEKLNKKLRQDFKFKKDLASARVFLELCSDKGGGAIEQVSRVSSTGALFENPTGCDDQVWSPGSEGAGGPKVLLVDLLGEPKAGYSKTDPELEERYVMYQKRWSQLFEKAALTIHPKLSEYDLLNFERKTDLVFKGKEAVEAEIEKIKELVR